MPFTTTYTSDPAGVVATFTGQVTGKEVITHLEQIADKKELVYRLGDMRAVTDLEVSPSELHKMAILECSVPEDFQLRKLALVGDQFKYRWIIDTYMHFVERWVGKRRQYETKVFTDIEEAWAWLEIMQPGDMGTIVNE